MTSWKDVLPSAANAMSFLDDHHFGGSVKHVCNFASSTNHMLKENKYWVVGALGLDEIDAFSVCATIRDQDEAKFLATTFLGKIDFSEDALDTDANTPIDVPITFNKLSNRGARRLMTKWTYTQDEQSVRVDFDDQVPNTLKRRAATNDLVADEFRKSFWEQSGMPFATEVSRLMHLAELYARPSNLLLTNNGHIIYTYVDKAIC